MKIQKSRRPFTVEPVIAADLIGTRVGDRATALARAQRVADYHRLTVAVWQDVPSDDGVHRLDLVRLVEPRSRKAEASAPRRRAKAGKPPPVT